MTWSTCLCITLTTLQLLIPATSNNPNTTTLSPSPFLNHALTSLLSQRKDSFRFIQIGSYVGATHNDPIFIKALEQQWSGVLVEPVPAVFEHLRRNYIAADTHLQDISTSNGGVSRSHINARLSFSNVAICEESKRTHLYYLSPPVVDDIISMLVPEGDAANRSQMREQLPNWSQQASSLLRSQMVSQLMKYFFLELNEAEIIADKSRIEIQCTTYETLVSKHKQRLQQEALGSGKSVVQVDYVHIDAEGYDWNIVLAIVGVKEKYSLPSILCYESMHIGDEHFRKEKIEWMLSKHDYVCEIVNNGEDTCCYQASIIGTAVVTSAASNHVVQHHDHDEM